MSSGLVPFAPDVLLFCDIFENVHAKPFSFLKYFTKHDPNSDAIVLELARKMDGLRQQLERPCQQAQLGGRPEESHLATLEEYLQFLKVVVDKIKGGVLEDVGVSWTSQSSATRFFDVPALQQEYCMVLHLYAATLCQMANRTLTGCQVSVPGGDDDSASQAEGLGQEKAQQVVTWLRRAAGVYSFLQDYLSTLASSLNSRRPDELATSMATALGCLALGAAQGVVARRAQERSGPTSLVAALHNAAVGFTEQGSEGIEKGTGEYNVVPAGLLLHLAALTHVHRAQVLRVMGQESYNKQEVGFAIAYLERAKDCMKNAQGLLQGKERRKDFMPAFAEIDHLWNTFKKENDCVYFQPVPQRIPVLPESKIMVSPIEYQPTELEETHFLADVFNNSKRR